MASGLLTGKYNDGIPDDFRANLEGYDWIRKRFESENTQKQILKVRELSKLAADLDTNMARLAIAWCLKNPNVSTVITGSSRIPQVHDNLQAIDLVDKMDDEVIDQIELILDNKPQQAEF